MAKYSNTKAKINEKITTNGAQAVTGGILNDVLQTMVDSLGADYQFGGLVQPGSSFTAGEQPVVFLATTPGTYTNFGGLVVADGEVALLVWSSTAWSKQTPDIATRTEVSQLGQYVDNLEWVKVVTDNEDKILYGVKTDGKFYFGAGCPPQIIELLSNKVDKIDGKGLSTNDFTNTAKEIVDCSSIKEDNEFLEAKEDSAKKVIEGICRNGVKANYLKQIFYKDTDFRKIPKIEGLDLENIAREYNELVPRVNKIEENITLPIPFVVGYNIRLADLDVGDVFILSDQIETSSNYSYAIVNVSYNERYTVTCSGGSNPRAYAFVDADGKIMYISDSYATLKETIITIPYGCSKLIVNNNNREIECSIYKKAEQLDEHNYNILSEDTLSCYINGLKFADELSSPIADLSKSGDLMVHVSTFKIINGKIYATYYVNRIHATELPTEHIARFVICDLQDTTDIQFYDVGFTVNSKSPDTPNDLWHIDGNEVTELYDTVMMTIDDNTIFILWTAKAGNNYYRIYRTYNITTGVFSDVQKNYYKVNGITYNFNTSGMEQAYSSNGIKHKPFGSDIGLMQKLSSRVEGEDTYYYSGIYYMEHTAIVKTKDLITWEFVATPDYAFKNDIQWENAVYVKNNKVYYMVRQFSRNDYAILTYFDLVSLQWHTPVLVQDCQSRYDFIEYNQNLYLAHSPNSRDYISIILIDTNHLENSIDIETANAISSFYPFMQTYNNELYMSYTQNRQHIYLSKFTIQSISKSTIATAFKNMFNI